MEAPQPHRTPPPMPCSRRGPHSWRQAAAGPRRLCQAAAEDRTAGARQPQDTPHTCRATCNHKTARLSHHTPYLVRQAAKRPHVRGQARAGAAHLHRPPCNSARSHQLRRLQTRWQLAGPRDSSGYAHGAAASVHEQHLGGLVHLGAPAGGMSGQQRSGLLRAAAPGLAASKACMRHIGSQHKLYQGGDSHTYQVVCV